MCACNVFFYSQVALKREEEQKREEIDPKVYMTHIMYNCNFLHTLLYVISTLITINYMSLHTKHKANNDFYSEGIMLLKYSCDLTPDTLIF